MKIPSYKEVQEQALRDAIVQLKRKLSPEQLVSLRRFADDDVKLIPLSELAQTYELIRRTVQHDQSN